MTSKSRTSKKQPEPATYSPADYASEFCILKPKKRGHRPSQSVGFTVANILYGWSIQAHHFGADSFKLTASQFEQAISAAMSQPVGAPFEPAFPPVSLDKLKKIKAR